MFVLVQVKDTIRIPPGELNSNQSDIIRDVLHHKFSNKVLHKQGLCISVYDFDPGESYCHPGDGGCHIRVVFRLVVFRPIPGEVLVGRVRQCDTTGMLVSVDFFDHIFIPFSKLQHPSHFDNKENLWVWCFEKTHNLFMDIGEEIRFRIDAIEYAKTEDELDPAIAEAAVNAEETEEKGDPSTNEAISLAGRSIGEFIPPMRVVASIQEDGLGLVSWWTD